MKQSLKMKKTACLKNWQAGINDAIWIENDIFSSHYIIYQNK